MLDNVPAAPERQSCHLWGCVVQQGCLLRGDGVQRQVGCLGEVAQLELEVLVKVQVLRLDVPAEVLKLKAQTLADQGDLWPRAACPCSVAGKLHSHRIASMLQRAQGVVTPHPGCLPKQDRQGTGIAPGAYCRLHAIQCNDTIWSKEGGQAARQAQRLHCAVNLREHTR